MINHIWSLICKDTKVDENNTLSIVDQYDELTFTLNTEDKNYKKGTSVVAPFGFTIVSLFFRDEKGKKAEMKESVNVLDPTGVKLGEFESNIVFEEKHSRMRNIMKLESIGLTTSGTYLFQVSYMTKEQPNTKKQVVSIPIDIVVNVNGEKV
jgi:hypothetical protein